MSFTGVDRAPGSQLCKHVRLQSKMIRRHCAAILSLQLLKQIFNLACGYVSAFMADVGAESEILFSPQSHDGAG